MSIFGGSTAAGSFEDARRARSCATCNREIFPENCLPGIGYAWERYCQCTKVQQVRQRATGTLAAECKVVSEVPHVGKLTVHLKPANPQQGEIALSRPVTQEQWDAIRAILDAKQHS